jgi:hypothetical protein
VYWSATVGNDELLDSHQRTAEQSLADGQETPNRTVYPEPAGSGTVWAVHVLPFQESAVGLWDPFTVMCPPTAMQSVADGQETPSASVTLPRFGMLLLRQRAIGVAAVLVVADRDAVARRRTPDTVERGRDVTGRIHRACGAQVPAAYAGRTVHAVRAVTAAIKSPSCAASDMSFPRA